MITEHDLEAFGYWSHELPEANKTPMEMVKEYAKTSGQKPDANLYAALIEEEFKEWLHEFIVYGTSDTNQLKELADLLYVIYGYANAKGWDLDEALRRVHENNLQRIYQDDGTIKRREDGKIVRNPNAPKVLLDDLL